VGRDSERNLRYLRVMIAFGTNIHTSIPVHLSDFTYLATFLLYLEARTDLGPLTPNSGSSLLAC